MKLYRLIFAIATLTGTTAGTIVALLAIEKPDWVAPVSSIAVAIVGVVAIGLEIIEFARQRPKAFRSERDIRNFMFDWIDKEGRVVIFSRDLSWVAPEPRIKELLVRKAQTSELTICVPNEIELTNELAREGARIVVYGELDHIPTSRFTIVRHGRQDTEVAIGKFSDGAHRIETFGPGGHPAFSMAEDLVAIVTNFDRFVGR